MNTELSRQKVRLSKKLLKALPADVSEALVALKARWGFASLTFSTVTPEHKFYAGEGERFTFLYGDQSRSVEMAAEHNLGASGQHHNIGDQFTCPSGTWVFNVYYYDKYYLSVYNVVESGGALGPFSAAEKE